MNHIFFLHSNICTIVAFKTIKELIEKDENVVVILNRGTKFPFFMGMVKIFDIQYITDKYRKPSSNIIQKFFNYRFYYLPCFDVKAKEIIGTEEFILYTPSYNQFALRSFFNSPFLRGYYYLEEGTMSYVSENILKSRYYSKLLFKGRLFSFILGVKEYYDYKMTSKFKGVICMSTYAFPWLKEKKIVNRIDEYLANIDYKPLMVDAIVVTGYLYEDINKIFSGFDIIFNRILLDGKEKKIAIKFHPTAASYCRQKCQQIRNYLEMKYHVVEFFFVEPSYSIEGSLYQCKSDLYSIFGMSSLCLYSLILGSSSFVVNLNDSITLEEISCVEDFLAKANA